MLHGGQVSFFLQLVNTALLRTVLFLSPIEDTDDILGSFVPKNLNQIHSLDFFLYQIIHYETKCLYLLI